MKAYQKKNLVYVQKLRRRDYVDMTLSIQKRIRKKILRTETEYFFTVLVNDIGVTGETTKYLRVRVGWSLGNEDDRGDRRHAGV